MVDQSRSPALACPQTSQDFPHNRFGVDVAGHDRSRADRGRMSDVNASSNGDARSNPALTSDPDSSANEQELHIAEIMRSGAEIGLLRIDGMRSPSIFPQQNKASRCRRPRRSRPSSDSTDRSRARL